MKIKGPIPLNREVTLRVFADVLLINISVLAALVVRFVYLVVFETARAGEDYRQIFFDYMDDYRGSIWLLVLVCLAIFAASGFYTHGRFYLGRYKALVVFQAVSLSYLLFGFLAFFWDAVSNLPRAALVLAWALNLALALAARFWAYLLGHLVSSEWYQSDHGRGQPVHRVLVIGGAGYIGSALLPKLLEQGYRVRLLDLLMYGTGPIAGLLDHPHLEVMQADFRQVDKVTEAMQGVDAVIHLGAIVGDPACALNEQLTIEINLMATRMIAEVAKGSGVERFIFASTCSVYGSGEEMLDECSLLNPVSLYARSKVASERVLLKLANSAGFAPVILRFGTIYGLSGRTRFDLVVNLLAAKAVVEGQITVYDGEQWRPFLHVDDAALALLQVLKAPLSLVRSQVFNVGSNRQNYTIHQIGDLIHSRVPGAKLLIQAGEPGDRRNYRVDFRKIHNVLGFEPRWTVEQGVEQVIEALRSGRVQNYRDAQYSNVRFLNDEALLRLRPEYGWARELIDAAVG